MTLYFKDSTDGYYEFADNAPQEWYAHLTQCAQQPQPQKTSEQISAELESAVDKHINAVAKADKWDSRITCTMRAGYPNPWQNKAIAFGQWMDACYAHCIQVHSDVVAGIRPIPTDAELIAELPVMVWPA